MLKYKRKFQPENTVKLKFAFVFKHNNKILINCLLIIRVKLIVIIKTF